MDHNFAPPHLDTVTFDADCNCFLQETGHPLTPKSENIYTLRDRAASMASSMSLYSVIGILILSTDASADSSRLFAKYYSAPHQSATQPTPAQPYASLKEQKAFEKGLLEKTSKQTSDVILYDNKVVVFKNESDVMLYVIGGPEENEILLYNVILALRDTLSILLKYGSFSRRFWSCRSEQRLTCIPHPSQKFDGQAHNHGKLRSGDSGD